MTHTICNFILSNNTDIFFFWCKRISYQYKFLEKGTQQLKKKGINAIPIYFVIIRLFA